MRKTYKLITCIVVAILAIVTILSSFTIVSTGYVGVRTTFGQISEEPVMEGFNVKIPFVQKIIRICTQKQDAVIEGQIWSETSERTAIFFENVIITYSVNGEKAAWLVANVSNYKNLITTELVSSAIKTASKQLNSTDATNRGKIEPLAKQSIQTSVNEKYGENVITIYKVVISNIDFEDSYNQAIARKQEAQLKYEEQAIVNKQNVEAASAEAESQIMKAYGEAEAIIVKAEAEAEANSLLDKSLTDAILNNRYYDTWNGQLPQVYGSDNTLLEIPLQ